MGGIGEQGLGVARVGDVADQGGGRVDHILIRFDDCELFGDVFKRGVEGTVEAVRELHGTLRRVIGEHQEQLDFRVLLFDVFDGGGSEAVEPPSATDVKFGDAVFCVVLLHGLFNSGQDILRSGPMPEHKTRFHDMPLFVNP